MTKAILFYRNSLLTKLIMLVILLVGGGNSVWGDTFLKTIDFSDDEWSGVTFSQGNTTTPDVHNGVTFYSKSSSKQFSLSNGVLTFPDNNFNSSGYVLGFPVTDIVGGVITIKVYNGSTATRFNYFVKAGATSFDLGDVGTINSSSSATPSTVKISNLSNTKAFIYIGRQGSSLKTITKIEVLTYDKTILKEDLFKSFYKKSASSVNAATLLSEADLPPYINMDVTITDYSENNTSSVVTPSGFDFSQQIDNSKYYRLKPSKTSKIVIGGITNVKTIRLYGNGSDYTGNISTSVSSSSTAIAIDPIPFENSKTTIAEYVIDVSGADGFKSDASYEFTITITGEGYTGYFGLWGLYIECVPSSYTVTYNYNGGSGSIANSTGSSITLSDGTGFTAPTGYTFAGWNTDPHGTGTSYASGETGVEAGLTLYAVWTQSGTIDDNGGTADGEYTATYNKAGIEITTAPTNSGYAVKGYYEAGTGDDLVASSAGALEASTTYTDASGYWMHTGSAPTLYAQWENTHELTVNVNAGDMGSAEAEETTLAEGAETLVTATAETGYKFRSWDVEGTRAELSSETDNPTTFTMGTADATVTANFSALETYTITYSKGANGSGDAIADGEKTEDADITLSSSTYTYANHLQTGWATSDGGDKAYELGGTYTGNANLTLYPYWIEQYTLTYDANGGSGSMSSYEGTGSITLTANTFTKTGYTFLGWATSQANADAHTIAYADNAAYTLSANATLYAVWGENFFTFTPSKTSGSLSADEVVTTTAGGVMDVVDETSLSYTTSGLNLGSNNSKLRVVLYDYLKTGSVILLKVYSPSGNGTSGRGVMLYNNSDEKSQKLTGASSASTEILKYTVTENDGFVGTNEFHIKRVNGVYLQSLTVTDCAAGGTITVSGWNTYSYNKNLDLSTISGGTAYVASSTGVGTVRLTETDAIVEAGTGLMIKGEAGATFTINTTAASATLGETNLLVGLPNGGTVEANDGNYVFGWTNAANPGFYFINSTEPTLGAGKAYLHVDGVVGARLAISFADETPTSINSINNSQELNTNDFYFDLQGRKVKNPAKGLYIVNGKKVFVGNKH